MAVHKTCGNPGFYSAVLIAIVRTSSVAFAKIWGCVSGVFDHMGSEIPPKISLTDIAARNAKPRAWPYKMGDAEGPFLPVTPAGGKLCRFRYRQAGKEKLLSIGSWPECVRHRNRNDADNLLANLHAGTWREIREERGKAGSMTANLIFRQNLSDRTRRHE